MNIEEHAQLEQKTGSRLIKKENIWWRQVRPSFYRPLLPFESYNYGEIIRCFPPWQTVQFPVKEESRANSQLHMIVFEDIQSYQLDTLNRSRRHDIKNAIKNRVTIRRIHDATPFISQAYSIYQSFYQRTHYKFQKNRNQKEKFDDWVHILMSFPDVYLLGAYLASELIAIGVCCIVDRILIYKSMINTKKSIPFRAQDLLLHYIREEIAKKENVDLIFMGMVDREPGINNFKLWRGAKILSLPAHLKIPVPVKSVLNNFCKSEYAFMIGELPKQIYEEAKRFK